ncbi:MAG: hypothetical protein WA020_03620 [Candidatus Acidiferrales bacterium]
MATTEWKRMWREFLNGIEKELRSAAPSSTKLVLNAFRRRLDQDTSTRRRKRFEQELEAVLERNPFLRSATRRYLSKRMQSALKAAAKAQDEAERILKQLDKPKKPVIN